MMRYSIAAFLATTRAAGNAEFNYLLNGNDWPDSFEHCKGPNQSPINLETPAENNKLEHIPFSFDDFGKQYTNQVTDIEITWKNNHTTQVAIDKEDQSTQTFISKIAKLKYNLGVEEQNANNEQIMGDMFTGVQFHFHAGSEHTINGERHDLEMHTVHLIHPKQANESEFKYAAVGIMFSVDDYTADLDDD